jgi:hypothetical protein
MLFHSQEFVLLFLPVAIGVFYALAGIRPGANGG